MADTSVHTIPANATCTCAHMAPTARGWHYPFCALAPLDQRWARATLADPVAASVEMSGMSEGDLDALKAEFGEQSRADRLREQRDRLNVELRAVEDGTLPWIEAEGIVTAAELAETFGFSPTNANNRLASLRRAGLVRRVRVRGQRGYFYHWEPNRD